MKMNCAKCGKRFNAEEHMYICPKCNHYHSQTGKRSQMTEKQASSEPFKENSKNPLEKLKKKENEFKDVTIGSSLLDMIDDIIAPDDDANDAPEFIQTLNGEQKVYTAKKKTEQKERDAFLDASSIMKKIGLALCIIIGFIMFISNAIGGFDQWSDDSDSWGIEEDGYYTDNEIVEVSYGTPMKFDTFTVYVIDAHEPEYADLKASSGNKLVQVDFETESSYEYEDESMWTDVEVIYDTDNWSGSSYACYDGDLTNEISLQDQLRDDGLVAEAQYSGSYFWIFEVPEEAEEIQLSIMSFKQNNETWNEYIQDENVVMDIGLDF